MTKLLLLAGLLFAILMGTIASTPSARAQAPGEITNILVSSASSNLTYNSTTQTATWQVTFRAWYVFSNPANTNTYPFTFGIQQSGQGTTFVSSSSPCTPAPPQPGNVLLSCTVQAGGSEALAGTVTVTISKQVTQSCSAQTFVFLPYTRFLTPPIGTFVDPIMTITPTASGTIPGNPALCAGAIPTTVPTTVTPAATATPMSFPQGGGGTSGSLGGQSGLGPILGGLTNPTRTPVPAAVAPAQVTSFPQQTVILPPSTGDAGLNESGSSIPWEAIAGVVFAMSLPFLYMRSRRSE